MDNGNVSPNKPSDNTGNTTPNQPSGNGTTQPNEKQIVTNNIVIKGMSDVEGSDNPVLLNIPVKGKVGETVRVGDFITPELLGEDKLLDNGRNLYKEYNSGYVDYAIYIDPNIKDFMYTIKEDGTEFVITARHEERIH